MSDTYRVAGPDLTAAQLHDILRLRVDVFVVEQQCPYPEIDGRDLASDTVHLWTGAPVRSYLRVLAEPDGGARIGRVCTSVGARGQGLAAGLMAAALDLMGDRACVLDAQVAVREFYVRHGFVAHGEPFDEDGIAHITMRRPPAAHSG